MKYLSIAITVMLLLTTSLFLVAAATGEDLSSETTSDIIKKGTQDYLKDFIEKKGIDKAKVENITEINFAKLPKEVSIENIDDTNIAIYEIVYEEEQEQRQVFVITYSVEQLVTQGDLIIAHDKRQFLNFGYNGEMTQSTFLNTATGVSSNRGYLMMREGSITGISTNLEIVNNKQELLEIVIYKNGKAVEFSNTISARSQGIAKDYDIQSNGIVRFSPGDLISVYLQTKNGVVLKDVITLVEITTTN